MGRHDQIQVQKWCFQGSSQGPPRVCAPCGCLKVVVYKFPTLEDLENGSCTTPAGQNALLTDRRRLGMRRVRNMKKGAFKTANIAACYLLKGLRSPSTQRKPKQSSCGMFHMAYSPPPPRSNRAKFCRKTLRQVLMKQQLVQIALASCYKHTNNKKTSWRSPP